MAPTRKIIHRKPQNSVNGSGRIRVQGHPGLDETLSEKKEKSKCVSGIVSKVEGLS